MCIRASAYGIKNGIIKEGDKVSGEDCRDGLTCVISVNLTNAQFEGQTKAKLGNSEIRTLVDGIVSDRLMQFLEENPVVARTILDKAMTANRARASIFHNKYANIAKTFGESKVSAPKKQ